MAYRKVRNQNFLRSQALRKSRFTTFSLMMRDFAIRVLCVLTVFSCLGIFRASAAPLAEAICADAKRPVLVIKTIRGDIEIELDEEAAPDAVRAIVRLVKGPVFDSELTNGNPFFKPFSYYDGLEFDRALRGHEVATAVRPPKSSIVIETQIDASALGLDKPFTQDRAEAMKIWQHLLFPHYINARKTEDIHPRLIEWVQANAKDNTVDFLLKATTKDVNEALGYRYVDGLPSRPVTRGSVSLIPLNPRFATPGLLISLRDRPDLTGKRMVIGKVRAGLAVAEQLAAARLTPEKTLRNRPLVPVLISSSSIDCRRPAAPLSLSEGKEEE